MTGAHVVVLANDVVPGMALPVAAPGLRAWGIAEGLRAHGHDVTVAVDERLVQKVWTRHLPPLRREGTLITSPGRVGELVRTLRPDAVVVTNANHVDTLGDLGSTRLVFDFFAPKILELMQDPSATEAAIAALTQRKLRALARSDMVIVNGRKKLDYVREWTARAGNANVPTKVVNMPIAPRFAPRSAEGTVRAVVSGYVQPWSHPGEWAEVIRPLLAEGRIELHLMIGHHWGGDGGQGLPGTFAELAAMPGVVRHGIMEFEDFRELMASCHFSIDLFARNPERELAFVTRTAVSLSTGLPAVHVPFTEVSELIREHNAGWLVEATDHAGIERAIAEAVDSPDRLATKLRGARSLARILEPSVAVKPLHRFLERVRR